MRLLLIIAPPVLPYMPLLGIAYISQFLLKFNIKVFVKDLNIEIYNIKSESEKREWVQNYKNFQKEFYIKNRAHLKKILNFIKQEKIDFVGFSVFNTNYIFSLELATWIKKEFPYVKIFFGGPQVFYIYSYNKNYLLNEKNVDYFIIGEGEKSILNLLQNKIYKKIIFGEQEKNIDLYPFPEFKEFNLQSYKRKNSIPVISSRGCINLCNFCTERLIFKYYRFHSPEYIIKAIKYYVEKYNIKWITFYDSIFNGHLSNTEKILDLIIKELPGIKWDAQISIRNMKEELIKKFKRSGCINLFIGLETGNSFILRNMNKNFTLKEARELFKKFVNNGINFEISLIVNYPGESEKDFEETINFILQNKNYIKKIAQINPYIYYYSTTVDITKGYNLEAGLKKVEILKNILKKNNIKYTNYYINNLVGIIQKKI